MFSENSVECTVHRLWIKNWLIFYHESLCHVIKCHSRSVRCTMCIGRKTDGCSWHRRTKKETSKSRRRQRRAEAKWKIALFAVCMRCHSHVLQLVQYSIFIDVEQALTGKNTVVNGITRNIALSHMHSHSKHIHQASKQRPHDMMMTMTMRPNAGANLPEQHRTRI